MICLLALLVFASLAAFSARYRPLAAEALQCVFRRVTLRPCTTGFDRRVKALIVGKVMRAHPDVARLLHRHLETFAWAFTLTLLTSAGYLAYGFANYYRYGSCQGPVRRGFCIFDPTGSRSRYSGIRTGHRGAERTPDAGDGPSLGPPDAAVTVIEFGSYGCNYTKEAASIVDDLLARHASRVRFVFRDFPLDAGDAPGASCEQDGAGEHAGATRAAVAAHCARRQDRFWEYHHLLLAEPAAIASCADLGSLAATLGMDADAFARCLDDPAIWQEVQHDFADGVAAGLYGAPTFYVNGVRLVAPSRAELDGAIVSAYEQATR